LSCRYSKRVKEDYSQVKKKKNRHSEVAKSMKPVIAFEPWIKPCLKLNLPSRNIQLCEPINSSVLSHEIRTLIIPSNFPSLLVVFFHSVILSYFQFLHNTDPGFFLCHDSMT
jgi:hypothetical protein